MQVTGVAAERAQRGASHFRSFELPCGLRGAWVHLFALREARSNEEQRTWEVGANPAASSAASSKATAGQAGRAKLIYLATPHQDQPPCTYCQTWPRAFILKKAQGQDGLCAFVQRSDREQQEWERATEWPGWYPLSRARPAAARLTQIAESCDCFAE